VDKSGVVKTSAGEVTSSVGDALTLTPAPSGSAFTVTVTAGGITNIAGTVTFTDNTTAAGGSLTPLSKDAEIEIKETAIITDRVLGVQGMAVNYVYNGTGLLQVKSNATLTVLPGTTIRFSKTGGGMEITDGATVKMLGEDKLRELDVLGNLSVTPGTKSGHITLKGGTAKGSWDGVYVKTDRENQLVYVDFINGGNRTYNEAGVLNIDDNNADAAKAGITHCTISGGLLHGLYLSNNIQLTAFDNNKIENVDAEPVYVDLAQIARLAKFDITSDFTNNAKPYIFVRVATPLSEAATLNATSVPYYFGRGSIDDLRANLTVNAGTTIYMCENAAISTGTNANNTGKLFINGTPEKPVTITRLPNTNYYWNSVNFTLFVNHSIKNCIIEYSGHWSGGSPQGAIYTNRDQGETGVLELENVVIRNSEHYGIVLLEKQYLVHTNVTFGTGAQANADGNVYYKGQSYTGLTVLP
jgi:hypothetical protein